MTYFTFLPSNIRTEQAWNETPDAWICWELYRSQWTCTDRSNSQASTWTRDTPEIFVTLFIFSSQLMSKRENLS